MTEAKSQDFPEHWQEKTLSEILKVVRGVSFPSEDKKQSPEEDHIACLRTANVQEKVDWDDLWYIPEKHISREEQYVRENDILISTANSYELVGKVSLVRDLPERATLGAFISLIRVPEGLDSKFFFYQLRSTEVRNEMRQRASTTTNISNISTSDLNEVPLGVPPLPEQRRIVAKIEELFTNLDAGMDDLQAAGQQLERYRLSVLQAAVEGRLTADWRRTRNPEPADQLLERILEKREKKWYKSRYKDPVEPEFGNSFPESPDGWTVTSFDSVLSHVTSGPRGWSDYYHEGDGVFILAQNVNPWKLDLSDTKNVNPPSDASGRDRAMVQKSDLLVTIVGANTGDVCRVDRELDEHWVCQSVALMRPALETTSKYLEIYLNSQLGQQQYERFAYGQGRPHLNFGQLKATPLLLPPLAEQKQIVDEVERLLSVADEAAATAEREQTRAERLRQSILKQAFSGQLVPHEEDAAPSAIEASSSNGQAASASGDTSVSTDEDDVIAEELYNGDDPGTQIEMDL